MNTGVTRELQASEFNQGGEKYGCRTANKLCLQRKLQLDVVYDRSYSEQDA